jgi:hypothetical protein
LKSGIENVRRRTGRVQGRPFPFSSFRAVTFQCNTTDTQTLGIIVRCILKIRARISLPGNMRNRCAKRFVRSKSPRARPRLGRAETFKVTKAANSRQCRGACIADFVRVEQALTGSYRLKPPQTLQGVSPRGRSRNGLPHSPDHLQRPERCVSLLRLREWWIRFFTGRPTPAQLIQGTEEIVIVP